MGVGEVNLHEDAIWSSHVFCPQLPGEKHVTSSKSICVGGEGGAGKKYNQTESKVTQGFK